MSGLLPSRGVRWLLLVLACLAAISLFLLATASANTELFARRYDLLLVLNGALVVLLMLLVGYQLWRLRRNLKAGVFGSRLAVRLVLLFALVAVLPGALVYAVSVQFLGKSIESWFDVRVDRALEGGLNLGRNALDYLLKDTSNKAGQIALTLGEAGAGQPVGAAQPRRRAGRRLRGDAVLVDRQRARGRRHRRLDRAAGAAAGAGAAPRAAAADVRGASSRRADGGLVLRVVTPVNTDDRLEPLKVLQVVEPVPKALAAGRREGAGRARATTRRSRSRGRR